MGRIFLLCPSRNIFFKIVIFEGLQKRGKKEVNLFMLLHQKGQLCNLQLTVKSSLGIELSRIGYFQNFTNDLMKAWLYAGIVWALDKK